ncbi:hypothetical protein MRB53_020904 [Persea americana]|uniref:Uncharacterized protein n=1 Tax=Persea americana TaxID=3435 RepID=A0ACC2L281_PERAE|nr:hypothetical protein MRB53_020904 [Persea americana]
MTGACSILHPISFCRATGTQLSRSPLPSILSFSSSSPSLRNFVDPCKKLHPSRTTHCSSSSGLSGSNSNAKDLAVLLEVEGVLVDIYRLGNCQAFNSAFQKLGLDCANWTEPIYLDLSRKAGGDEERMLVLFFNRIGWPTSLPTSEKEKFMKSVLREKKNALEEFVTTKSLPLRPGVENFIDDALRENIPVVILIAYSKIGDKMARSIIEKLGHERTSKINVVGKEEVEGSFYGQLVLGKGVSSSLDEQLAKEVKRAASVEKQRVAKEVASLLKLSVDINTSPSERLEKIVATLRAGAEYGGLPVHQCVLIAGSQSGVLGADNIGMPCVVLRSSFTSSAEFPLANAVMDGFGGADLTISKLCHKRWS